MCLGAYPIRIKWPAPRVSFSQETRQEAVWIALHTTSPKAKWASSTQWDLKPEVTTHSEKPRTIATSSLRCLRKKSKNSKRIISYTTLDPIPNKCIPLPHPPRRKDCEKLLHRDQETTPTRKTPFWSSHTITLWRTPLAGGGRTSMPSVFEFDRYSTK